MVAVVLLDGRGFDRACFRRSTLDTLPPFIRNPRIKNPFSRAKSFKSRLFKRFFRQEPVLSDRKARFTISGPRYTGNQRKSKLGLPAKIKQIEKEMKKTQNNKKTEHQI